jgi:hypothetical protein
MGLDLRLPIGLMFALIGALLVVVGLITGPEKKALDININLWWGLALIVFAVFMLFTSWRAGKKAAVEKKD